MVNDKTPNVLVTSVSCWNPMSGSDTLSSLLSNYPSENISTICFKTDISTSPVSSSYFYICENDVIRSIFNKNIETGFERFDNKTSAEKQSVEKKRYSFWSRHRNWFVLLMRELLWVFGKAKSKQLTNYINKFRPEVLFCPFESYLYFNSINLWVAKKWNIPVVAIIWDDNFTFKQNPFTPFGFIYRSILRRQIKKMSKVATTFFAMTPKAQIELNRFLKRDIELLTKCVKASDEFNEEITDKKSIRMAYTGKLNLGRNESILKLINAISRINLTSNHKFYLDIYSKNLQSKKLEKLVSCNEYISYKGFVSQDEIKKIQKEYDLLVCVEAIRGKYKNVSRLSLSTKIVDYLASGRCIFNISLKDTATYSYLYDNQAGFCANNKKTILEQLREIDLNPLEITKRSKNALKLCKENHTEEFNQRKLYKAFKEHLTKSK